ncbi:MAG: hypothetical protein IRZ13_21025, partial [Acetobacteraceae bacterium]|nr:hypothetical protein [Acetobacteraceae bacterium]
MRRPDHCRRRRLLLVPAAAFAMAVLLPSGLATPPLAHAQERQAMRLALDAPPTAVTLFPD